MSSFVIFISYVLFFFSPIISFFLKPLLRVQHDSLILLALNYLKSLQEMLLARLDRSRVLLVAGQVGVNELDQAVEILGRDLFEETVLATGKGVGPNEGAGQDASFTYRFVLLVKVVDISVEDLDKQLN